MIGNLAIQTVTPSRDEDVVSNTDMLSSASSRSRSRGFRTNGVDAGTGIDPSSAVAKTWPPSQEAGSGATKLQTATPFETATMQLSLEPLQEWEGYVIHIDNDTFIARLVDLTATQNIEEEIAEFSISDLSNDDLLLLKEGAVFRWVIGYQRRRSGQKIKTSQIVFRRLPAWSKLDLRQAQKRAQELSLELIWD